MSDTPVAAWKPAAPLRRRAQDSSPAQTPSGPAGTLVTPMTTSADLPSDDINTAKVDASGRSSSFPEEDYIDLTAPSASKEADERAIEVPSEATIAAASKRRARWAMKGGVAVQAANLPGYIDAREKAEKADATWQRELDVTDREFGATLGSGAFGTAHVLEKKGGGADRLVFKVANDKGREELKREALNYERLGAHPNFPSSGGLKTVTLADGSKQEGLVLEHIKGGRMGDVIDKLAAQFPDRDSPEFVGAVQHMMRQMVQGLYHMEVSGLIHTDVREDNIMVDQKTGLLKIIDLGNAYDPLEGEKSGSLPFRGGTVAPEHLLEKGSAASDAYSVGAVAYKAMTGNINRYGAEHRGAEVSARPSATEQASNAHSLNVEVASGTSRPALATDDGAGDVVQRYTDFINAMLHPDPAKRLSAAEAIQHPFVTESVVDPALAQQLLKNCFEDDDDDDDEDVGGDDTGTLLATGTTDDDDLVLMGEDGNPLPDPSDEEEDEYFASSRTARQPEETSATPRVGRAADGRDLLRRRAPSEVTGDDYFAPQQTAQQSQAANAPPRVGRAADGRDLLRRRPRRGTADAGPDSATSATTSAAAEYHYDSNGGDSGGTGKG